jgi:hypothetical protein
MNTDDFEEQLQRQPIRPVPGEWRSEILSAAQRLADQETRITHPAPRMSWWRELLWPCPQAWAGLAAAWVIILAINSTSPGDATTIAKRPAPPAPETLLALREQRRLLTELIAPVTDVPEPAKAHAPRPRSDAPTSLKLT